MYIANQVESRFGVLEQPQIRRRPSFLSSLCQGLNTRDRGKSEHNNHFGPHYRLLIRQKTLASSVMK